MCVFRSIIVITKLHLIFDSLFLSYLTNFRCIKGCACIEKKIEIKMDIGAVSSLLKSVVCIWVKFNKCSAIYFYLNE